MIAPHITCFKARFFIKYLFWIIRTFLRIFEKMYSSLIYLWYLYFPPDTIHEGKRDWVMSAAPPLTEPTAIGSDLQAPDYANILPFCGQKIFAIRQIGI